ncbi:MAG TPA: hypothetical protein ENK27_07945 [Desulfobulbus sp.]|nr:hypothetical protein [Desulfobulbus sp.]
MGPGSSGNDTPGRRWLPVLAVAACLLLPLAGALLAGQPLGRFLEFPPLTRYVRHAPFSLPLFLAGLALFAFLAGSLAVSLYRSRDRIAPRPPAGPMPWWGWTGLLLTLVAWILAWTRFPWFSALQPYTFTPLWLGYILGISGWCVARSGSCLLLRQPGRFLLLFPASSLFWWYFEYLNRFVQNWYYIGVEDFSATAYVLHATICFSTVLPAVAVTTELLDTVPWLHGPLRRGRCLAFCPPRPAGLLLLLLSLAGLAGIGIVPDLLFPLVWVAPLLVLLALQVMAGQRTVFASLARGDWRPLLLPPLAALVCGFFWEMWNWQSLPRWHYSIPFVDALHLFAMPLPGYMGYLPFGLECYALTRLLALDPLAR